MAVPILIMLNCLKMQIVNGQKFGRENKIVHLRRFRSALVPIEVGKDARALTIGFADGASLVTVTIR
jgi:hypothetical protein